MSFFQIPIVNIVRDAMVLADNTATAVTTADRGNITIAHIHIANTDSGAVTATVDIHDGSAVVATLVAAGSISAGEYLDLEGTVLNQGESLRVTSGDADGHLDILVHRTVASAAR